MYLEHVTLIVNDYDDVFDVIEREGLDSNVSVKLTALGLKLSYELCLENVEEFQDWVRSHLQGIPVPSAKARRSISGSRS